MALWVPMGRDALGITACGIHKWDLTLVFYPPEVSSNLFGGKVFLPKLERWFVGWIEVHAYLMSWLFGRCGLQGFDVLRPRSELGYGLHELDPCFLVLLKWLKNSSTHLLNMESFIFKSVIILWFKLQNYKFESAVIL